MNVFTGPRSTLPIGTWKSVFVIIDDGSHSLSEYSEVERLVSAHAARHRGTAGILTVIPSGAKQPSEDARRAISSTLDRLAPKVDGVVWVVEGTGFVSAMVRATLTTINLARRRQFPARVATNVTEGLGWLLEKRPNMGAVDFAQGIAEVESIRGPVLTRRSA